MPNETSLIDKDGEAVAYIATDNERTIYLWKGRPVAYLDGENVYGFNGNHLGWFIEGVIFGHDGFMLCAIRSKISRSLRFERFKGFKSFKPFKGFKRFAPFKPTFSNQFSKIPCSVVLDSGRR